MTAPKRQNALVTIVTNPQSAQPLTLRLVLDRPAYRGVPFAGRLVAEGGTGGYVYALASGTLPAGLSLNTTTGEVTGTPSAVGYTTFAATVQDSSATGVIASFAITVLGQLFVVAGTPVPGEIGVAYDYQFIVRDVDGTTVPSGYAKTSGTLPAGLSLTAAGRLSGTPTAPDGISYAVIRCTAPSGDIIDIPVAITIAPALAVTFPDRSVLGAGQRATIPFVISGGVAPFSVSIVNVNDLPPGLRAQRNKGATEIAITGTPTAAGGWLNWWVITDACGASVTGAFRVRVLAQPNTLGAAKDGVALPSRSALRINFAGALVQSVANNDDETTVTFGVPATAPLDVSEYRVSGIKVVGARDTGWGTPSGFGITKAAWSIYITPGTISSTYSATVAGQLTTALAALDALSKRVAALQNALTAHGLIGP